MTLTNIQNDGFASDEWGWFDIHSLTLWKVPTEYAIRTLHCSLTTGPHPPRMPLPRTPLSCNASLADSSVTETQSASKTYATGERRTRLADDSASAGGSSSSAPSGGGSSDDSATPVGAIAGGVVVCESPVVVSDISQGGLVALAVIAGVVKLYKGYTSEKEEYVAPAMTRAET